MRSQPNISEPSENEPQRCDSYYSRRLNGGVSTFGTRNALSIAPPFAGVAVGATRQFTAANLPAGSRTPFSKRFCVLPSRLSGKNGLSTSTRAGAYAYWAAKARRIRWIEAMLEFSRKGQTRIHRYGEGGPLSRVYQG